MYVKKGYGKIMKKFISLTLVVCALVASLSALAIVPVSVFVNGEKVQIPEGDVCAQIINNSTMIPMRNIFEELGANLNWIASAQSIIATKGSKIIAMKVGSTKMTVTDALTGENVVKTLPVAPMMITAENKEAYGARTVVPLRAISESLNKKVDWDGETYTVTITDK